MKNKTIKTIACIIAGLTLSACVGSVNLSPNETTPESRAEARAVTIPIARTARAEARERRITESSGETGGVARADVLAEVRAEEIAENLAEARGDTEGINMISTGPLSRGGYHASVSVIGELSSGGANPSDLDLTLQTAINRNSYTISGSDVEHTFVPNDRIFINNFGEAHADFMNSDTRTFVAFGVESFAEFVDVVRGEHETIQGTYIQYNTDTFRQGTLDDHYTFGFMSAGVLTPAHVVSNQSAMGIYGGSIILDVIHQGDLFLDFNGVDHYEGIITMIADFDANTMLGAAVFDVDSSAILSPGSTPQAIDPADFAGKPVIAFNTGIINGNGFQGTFSMDSTLLNDLGLTNQGATGYSGNFFGENANDIAGVLGFTSANASGTVIGVGGFRADGVLLNDNGVYDPDEDITIGSDGSVTDGSGSSDSGGGGSGSDSSGGGSDGGGEFGRGCGSGCIF